MTRNTDTSTPRPFLKWAGGKSQLLPELLRCTGRARPFNAYHEPFVGGGALFFALRRGEHLGRGKVFLSDVNANLIEIYEAVREEPERVIRLLRGHERRHSEAHYYAVRGETPGNRAGRAARLIYLNRTCFNGLFRENSKGEFNVPMGRYKNPLVCDEENLLCVSECLKGCVVEARHFATVLEYAQRGDLVYFDPPYHPLTATSNFTDYSKHGFGEESQRLLAWVFGRLSENGVKVVLSNSDTPLVHELYKGHRIEKVYARRNINSRQEKRGKIAEALVTNF